MESTATQQRDAARAIANHVRITNARTCKNIRRLSYAKGTTKVARLLHHGDLDGPLGTLPIWRLVTAIRSMGDIRAEELLYRADIQRHRRPLRTLTPRQRRRLALELDALPVDPRTR
ncbi:MAG TPA: hypothetical protein VE645_19095 [Pseudonocardiaceae bacterium]|jgi:hypothetical protein|nr:hypothetical protein [Pseudonocardiaceae bacterium]